MSTRRGADHDAVNVWIPNQFGCLRVVTHAEPLCQGLTRSQLAAAQGADSHPRHIILPVAQVALSVSSGTDNSDSESQIWSVSRMERGSVRSTRMCCQNLTSNILPRMDSTMNCFCTTQRPFLLRLFALGSLLMLFGHAATASAQEPLIINEVLADPASDWNGDGEVDFKGDEWVEVRNVGSVAIDMSTYWLRDDTGDEIHLQLFGMIAPGDVAVFYGSDAMAWQAAQGMSTSGLSLNNGGDIVRLLRTIRDSSELELMYVIHYESHMAEDDRSNGWNLAVDDWQLFDALLPYTGTLEPGGTGCPPSPGAHNLCNDTVASEEFSFGGLKAIYR